MGKTSIKRGKTVFLLTAASWLKEGSERQAAADSCGLPTL